VNQGFVVGIDGGDDPLLGASVADSTDQSPSIDPFDGDDLMPNQIFGQGTFGSKVAEDAAIFPDHEAGNLRLPGLDVFRVDPDVSDHWVSHGDDLTAVTRVGQDLLVPGDGRVENHFAIPFTIGADRYSFINGAVFQGQEPTFSRMNQRCTPRDRGEWNLIQIITTTRKASHS
jgi:hypothetical protein